MTHPATTQAGSRKQSGMPASHTRNSGSFGPSGEMPVPKAPGPFGSNRDKASPAFDVARSPPNNASNKNTKHVPCKFFRQGACQAGNACPFSHSMDPMLQAAPCKYFMKGNCKFGAKCALAHYLPNGHRVSRADLDATYATGTNRGRFEEHNRPQGQSFMSTEQFQDPFMAQPFAGPDFFPAQDPFLFDDDENAHPDNYNPNRTSQGFDTSLHSPPTSQFGSPPEHGMYQRQTADNLRSALNAPLPASFDANSLPHIAKYGPFGQSVPDKFGMRSPPSSALTRKLGSPPDISIGVRSTIGTALRNVSSPLSGSPQAGDDSMGRRIMHSQKPARPQMISASVPRTAFQDWDENIGAETDLLPNSLHDEVLLPQEKMRRLSRPDDLSSSLRDSPEGLTIPRRGSATVGSPPMGSSPSRFRGLFEEQRKREEAANQPSQTFGHVGSPLRESWMPHETAAEPKLSHHGIQISGISQQMARMELNRTESVETNGSSNTRPFPALRNSSNISSRQGLSPGFGSRRIDEEGEGGFFEMDDENSKRSSGSAWALPPQSSPLSTTNIIGSGLTAKLEDTSRIGSGTNKVKSTTSDVKNGGIAFENGARPIFGFRS